MVGFTFRGRHSDEFGIYSQNDNRTMLPQKRQIRYEIPGRDGYLDLGEETYDNRIISLTITFAGTGLDLESLWDRVRQIAHWLSDGGDLIFDDEPDKAYTAQIVSGIDVSQMAMLGLSQLTFDCGPFAQTPNYRQAVEDFTDGPHTIKTDCKGTQEAPCIIYIKNAGSSNITGIRITRQAEV